MLASVKGQGRSPIRRRATLDTFRVPTLSREGAVKDCFPLPHGECPRSGLVYGDCRRLAHFLKGAKETPRRDLIRHRLIKAGIGRCTAAVQMLAKPAFKRSFPVVHIIDTEV